MTGCAGVPTQGSSRPLQTAALRDRLLSLDATVDRDEASQLADTALERSAELARQYRAVRPAWLHNVFIHAGRRERGLCFHWTNDLFPRLHELGLKTLELHLGVARMDTWREHNSIVVTAARQPFAEGVVLDAWRHSGQLWWESVATDKYRWKPLPRERVAPELEALLGP